MLMELICPITGGLVSKADANQDFGTNFKAAPSTTVKKTGLWMGVVGSIRDIIIMAGWSSKNRGGGS